MNSFLSAMSTGIVYPNIIASNFLKNKKIANKQQAISTALYLSGVFNNKLDKLKVVEIVNDADKYFKQIKNTSRTINDVRKTTLQTTLSKVILNSIPSKYTSFVWLPSESEHPDIEHQQHYGLTFSLKDGANGDFPAMRPNCKCGMQLIE